MRNDLISKLHRFQLSLTFFNEDFIMALRFVLWMDNVRTNTPIQLKYLNDYLSFTYT